MGRNQVTPAGMRDQPHLFHYEKADQQLASWSTFICRVLKHILVALVPIVATIMVGILGYHYIEGWAWIDSFEEAAMLLSGMGPVGDSQTVAGKVFAAFYAMWSGLVLVVAMGIILQPFIHRVLHRFHSVR
jgi:hypothetical protein